MIFSMAFLLVFFLVQQRLDGADLLLQQSFQLQEIDAVGVRPRPLKSEIRVDQTDAGTGRLVGGVVVADGGKEFVAVHAVERVERAVEEFELFPGRALRGRLPIDPAKFAFDFDPELFDGHPGDVGDGEETFDGFDRQTGEREQFVARDIQQFAVQDFLFPAGEQEAADLGAVIDFGLKFTP